MPDLKSGRIVWPKLCQKIMIQDSDYNLLAVMGIQIRIQIRIRKVRISIRIRRIHLRIGWIRMFFGVPDDPHLDPLEQGSGSGSSSGSFHHKQKIVRKTLISSLWLFTNVLDQHLDPDPENPYFLGIPDLHLDTLVRRSDLRIRICIRTKISWISNNAYWYL